MSATARDARQLHLRVDLRGDGPTVRLRGDLDVHTAAELRQLLTDLVAAGAVTIVLDLGELGFIDSAGLGVMVGGLKRARERGGDMLLASPPPAVSRVLEMTGLSTVFQVLPVTPADP